MIDGSFKGWQRSRARVCPRWVVGKRCVKANWLRRAGPCECIWIDHHLRLRNPKLWFTPNRERVMTLDPDQERTAAVEFRSLLSACENLGIDLTVDFEDPQAVTILRKRVVPAQEAQR